MKTSTMTSALRPDTLSTDATLSAAVSISFMVVFGLQMLAAFA